MALKKHRIILDTNWYISASINKNSRRILYDLLINEQISILYCEEIVLEYLDVIARKKFKKIISFDQASRFISLVISKMELIQLETTVQESRDPKDNFLLSLSVDGKADYLITGDQDLLVLQTTGNTQILRLPDFLAL